MKTTFYTHMQHQEIDSADEFACYDEVLIIGHTHSIAVIL
jgi:hypothetical protein